MCWGWCGHCCWCMLWCVPLPACAVAESSAVGVPLTCVLCKCGGPVDCHSLTHLRRPKAMWACCVCLFKGLV